MEFIFIYVVCLQVCVCPRHGLSIRRTGSGGILFLGGSSEECKLCLWGRCPARLVFT